MSDENKIAGLNRQVLAVIQGYGLRRIGLFWSTLCYFGIFYRVLAECEINTHKTVSVQIDG